MENKKNTFASGVGFILSAAGSAVGLGNLWAFPYKTAANGGAAFVLMYIICVLLIGFVTMLCEFHIGRRAAANPVSAYKKVNKNIGWFGLVGVAIPAFIICYYSVLGGYTVKYTLNSFSGNSGILESFSTNVGEVILFTAIFIVLALVIIMGGVKDGIEKMSKVLMPVLFFILLAVAVYSLCLGEGVRDGLNFYLNPDFSSIGFSSVLAAMGQAFFSLSLGMGTMISYGSYTGRDINIVKSTGMICLFDTFAALLSGLAIFPAVAHFDPSLLENAQGLTLMFNILPEVFNSMGAFGQIISFSFFAMVAIAALTSVVSLVEVVTQFILQRFKLNRSRAALGVVLTCFAVSIPVGMSLGTVAIAGESGISVFGMDLITFFDEVTNTVLMPVCTLFACFVIGWLIKPKNAMAEMEEGGTPLGFVRRIFPLMVRFVTPLLIIVVEIGGVVTKIRAGQWFVVAAAYALLAIAAVAYFIFCKNADTGTNADEELETVK